MEIIKNNLLSIISGAAALLCVVAVTVWPVPAWTRGLEERLDESLKALTEIQRLNTTRFTLPIVDPRRTEATEAAGFFPNPAAIKAGEDAVRRLHDESVRLMQVAMAMNERQPLVASALPAKTITGPAEFKQAYYRELARLRKLMNAAPPPTQADIDAERDRLWLEVWKPRISTVDGKEINAAEVQQQFEEKVLPVLADDVKNTRARRCSVYLAGGPEAGAAGAVPAVGRGGPMTAGQGLMYHPGIPPEGSPQLPDIVDIWIAQLGMWIQQDIVAAIVQTNDRFGRREADKSLPVTGAVVKRVVRIDIPPEYVTLRGKLPISATAAPTPFVRGYGRGGGGGGGGDQDTAADETATISSRNYAYSPTGRVCNPLYDVMHFTVVLDIDANEMDRFLSALVERRFITILSADVKAVDQKKAYELGLVYGSSPVVQLTLKCEALFLREWTVGPRRVLMPREVQKLVQAAVESGGPGRRGGRM